MTSILQPPDVTRRRILLGGTALLATRTVPARAERATSALAALERRHGGKLGVFALDLQTGRTLGHRANERFKLMSTFKAVLSAMVLAEVAAGRDRLDALVRYGASDLMDASPVTSANVARGAMSVRAMAEATMIRSDNAAANLLMRRVGGPARVTAFLRGLGDPVSRIDHYEGDLAPHPLPADSSTPRQMAETMRTILLGPTLPAAERRLWEAWMAGNVVGGSRLRAAFPAGWIAGDRTGTGDGLCNDIAFARRPHAAPLLVSAFHAAPGIDLARQEAILRDVARLVVGWQAHPAR